MTESENKKIAGRNRLKNVEGDGDLIERLLRDDVRGGVVENGIELQWCGGCGEEFVGKGFTAEERDFTAADER